MNTTGLDEWEMTDPAAAVLLTEAIESAQALGIRVTWAPAHEDGVGRLRLTAGRYLDDGVAYVVLHEGQTPTEALSALRIGVQRLLRWDNESWQVSREADGPWLAFRCLGDVRNRGGRSARMEDTLDVRETLAAAS
jgi:hypothetical protein